MSSTADDKAAQLAKLKAELNRKTMAIRQIKQEGGDFMGVVAEIEAIKAQMKALGGIKGKKNKNKNKQKQKQKQTSKGSGGNNTNSNNSSNGNNGGSNTGGRSKRQSSKGTHHDASVQTMNQVVSIFSHLQKDARSKKQLSTTFSKHEKIHPSVIKMGLKFSEGILDSVNSRTVGMLEALKNFISDLQLKPNCVFSLELGKLITAQINHLVTSRRHTLAMGNVINWLKSKISLLDNALSHEEAKASLCDDINYFIKEKIEIANEVRS